MKTSVPSLPQAAGSLLTAAERRHLDQYFPSAEERDLGERLLAFAGPEASWPDLTERMGGPATYGLWVSRTPFGLTLQHLFFAVQDYLWSLTDSTAPLKQALAGYWRLRRGLVADLERLRSFPAVAARATPWREDLSLLNDLLGHCGTWERDSVFLEAGLPLPQALEEDGRAWVQERRQAEVVALAKRALRQLQEEAASSPAPRHWS